jgi:alkylated DNA repair dioxygenase AlkB
MVAQVGPDLYIETVANTWDSSVEWSSTTPVGNDPLIAGLGGAAPTHDAIPPMPTNLSQLHLFEPRDSLPEGFQYQPELLTEDEEGELIDRFRDLPFKEYEFHGFLGKRRVVSFGWKYDFNTGKLQGSDPIPEFILPIREKAAAFATVEPRSLVHVLVTEYSPGTAIGWHRDRPHYEDVIGISLVSECVFRLRRKAGSSWQRRTAILAPRSVYVLRGPVRNEWEHSIPAVTSLRYSITFRNLRVR